MKKITKLLSIALCLAMLMGLAVAVSAATPAEIVDTAYALGEGESTSEAFTLTGEITGIDKAYDSYWKNISVVIEIEGKEDKPILCYRLAGEGADALAVGDTITVTGTFTNYNGTIEFAQGCTLDKVVKGEGEVPTQPEDPKDVLDAAYALEDGQTLPYSVTLTGKITELNGEYNEDYKDIDLTIQVGDYADQKLLCYHLKGEGVDKLAVGDKITVTGNIKNYKGTIEFTNCTFVPVEDQGPVIPADPGAIVDAAYALGEGESTSEAYTLTGKITKIDKAYDSYWKNISVVIEIEGKEDKPILCYRLAGEGADALAVGDTITVTGTFTNYNGTIEFAQGCTLDKVVKGEGEVPTQPEDPKDVLDAAYALEDGESLAYVATLTGKITELNGEYNEEYKDIDLTIQVGDYADQKLLCYHLKGEGVDTLAVGDKITVTGNIKNYMGTIEFTNCTFVAAENDTPVIPGTGDMGIGALVVAMLAATAGAVIISKKKEF